MIDPKVYEGIRIEGRYRVLPDPKEGSHSLVFRAEDLNARAGEPRLIIVKILCPEIKGPASGRLIAKLEDYFALEAEALDRARHDHIVRLISTGSAVDITGRYFKFQILEYMAGGTVEERCWHKRLTLEEAVDYLKQIVSAITCAHDLGYIHRDLKPENYLLSEDLQRVKLADFGVARREQDAGTMTFVGSVTYAAPEHHPLLKIRSSGHINAASDVYSLGKSFYRMVGNEKPDDFDGQPITEWPLSVENEPWAQNLLKVIHKATQDEPRRRHQSVADFLRDVEHAIESASPKPPPHKTAHGKTKSNGSNDTSKNVVSSLPKGLSLISRIGVAIFVLAIGILFLLLSVPKNLEIDKVKQPESHPTLASLPLTPQQLKGRIASPLPEIDVNLREEPGQSKNLVCIINRNAQVKALGAIKILGKEFKWFQVEVIEPGDAGETFCKRGAQGWAFGEKLQVNLDKE